MCRIWYSSDVDVGSLQMQMRNAALFDLQNPILLGRRGAWRGALVLESWRLLVGAGSWWADYGFVDMQAAQK